VAEALASGAQITVPVRRPIAYFAGMTSDPPPGNPSGPLVWTEMPATYSDLSTGTPLDGQSQVGSNVVLIVAAGPNLYMVTQAAMNPTGALVGTAKLMPISMTDHSVGAAMSGTMTGAVIDGAGSDDGTALAIGTSTELFAVDTASGMARVLADGSFSRVAILGSDTGELTAVAIKNRGAGTCATSAELWWAPITGAMAGPAKMIATGGFSDIATDRGHAYYVDACKGELGEVTAASARMLRTLPGVGGAAGSPTGKPTMLAVSGGQAYVGWRRRLPARPRPRPRRCWSRRSPQRRAARAVERGRAAGDPGDQRPRGRAPAQRELGGGQPLEVGAGGDYVALTTSAHFHGAEIVGAGFPTPRWTSRSCACSRRPAAARSSATAAGATARSRSTRYSTTGAAPRWQESTPATADLNHHIASMTFLFGKQ